MSFSVQKQELIKIVSTCQERSYDEEIQLLREKGDTTDWLFSALASHHQNGISNDDMHMSTRREKYGSNVKQVKQPPGFMELFCDAMEDFTLRILLVAAILSIVLETSTAKAEERSKAWI